MTWILIAAGGAGGAVTRYALDSWVTSRLGPAFPFGTLLINVSGSFLLGLLFALVLERGLLPAELRAPLAIGFLGAYTTFSTLMLESWALIERGAWIGAALNVGGSVVLGMVAVVAGLALGRAV
jgi:CrcB protein